MSSYGRPNRSDVHLTREEEAKIEEETKEYFDGITPKRHSKPQRSEYSSSYVDSLNDSDPNTIIPELSKFQHLENDPQKLVYNGSKAAEEFVETEYYKDLNCVGKQHHTTGTGFIRVESGDTNENRFRLGPDSSSETDSHPSCKGNPATNDWIPATSDSQVVLTSDKPNRSDN